LTFSIRISTSFSNHIGFKSQLPTQPQPFAARNEMGNPKGADMKPPSRFLYLPGDSYSRLVVHYQTGSRSSNINKRRSKNMKKIVILGCLILFLVPPIWAQEKAEAPVWKVGDKWTYKTDTGVELTNETIGDEKDLFITARSDKVTLHYDKKDMSCVKAIRDGKEDKAEGGRLKNFYNFPLFSGKKWTSRYLIYNPAYRMDNDILAEYSVVGVEDVEVPAGKFKAFKVTVKLNITVLGPRQRQFFGAFYYWWAPDVRGLIKYETDGNSIWEVAKFRKYELVSFDLK